MGVPRYRRLDLKRGIPFFGFDPGMKIGGTPYCSLDLKRGIPFFGFDPGVKIRGTPLP